MLSLMLPRAPSPIVAVERLSGTRQLIRRHEIPLRACHPRIVRAAGLGDHPYHPAADDGNGAIFNYPLHKNPEPERFRATVEGADKEADRK